MKQLHTKAFFLLALLFMGTLPALAQSAPDTDIDSLKFELLDATTEDSLQLIQQLERFYLYRAMYNEAIFYSLTLLQLRRSVKDTLQEAASLNNIGMIYANLKKVDKAKTYYRQAMVRDSLNGNALGQSATMNNLGLLLFENGEYDQAMKYFYQSLSIKVTEQDELGIASTYLNIGLVEEEKNQDYDEAISRYRKALSIFQRKQEEGIDTQWDIANAINNIGIAHLKRGELDTAQRHLTDAYQRAKDLNANSILLHNLMYQAQLFAQRRDYKKAYEFKSSQYALYDSLFQAEKIKDINNMEAELESKKLARMREKKIHAEEIAKKSGQQNTMLLILLLLFVASKFLLFRLFYIRRKSEKALKQERDNVTHYLDMAEAIFLLIDRHGIIKMVNKRGCEITGYTEAELKGKNIFDHLLSDEEEAFGLYNLKDMLSKHQQNLPQQLESRIIGKQGEVIYTTWTFTWINDEQGNPEAVLASGNDITALREAEVRETLALIHGQEQERNRIAQDLHDGIGPLLSATKLQLGSISRDEDKLEEALQQSKTLLDNTIQEIRIITQNLSPTRVRNVGLVRAMKDICEHIMATNTIVVSFEHYRVFESINESTELAVFRIFQELVNNVLKHAQATKLEVQLIGHRERLILTVEDDGQGFVYSGKQFGGMGLQNIHARVRALDGNFDIDTQLGRGTAATVQLPVFGHSGRPETPRPVMKKTAPPGEK